MFLSLLFLLVTLLVYLWLLKKFGYFKKLRFHHTEIGPLDTVVIERQANYNNLFNTLTDFVCSLELSSDNRVPVYLVLHDPDTPKGRVTICLEKKHLHSQFSLEKYLAQHKACREKYYPKIRCILSD